MPFKSKRQLQVCYAKKMLAQASKAKQKSSSWDCDKWLAETKNPQCLPTTVNSKRTSKCKPLPSSLEEGVGPVITGKRGGKFFYVSGIKVYVPKTLKSDF